MLIFMASDLKYTKIEEGHVIFPLNTNPKCKDGKKNLGLVRDILYSNILPQRVSDRQILRLF